VEKLELGIGLRRSLSLLTCRTFQHRSPEPNKVDNTHQPARKSQLDFKGMAFQFTNEACMLEHITAFIAVYYVTGSST